MWNESTQAGSIDELDVREDRRRAFRYPAAAGQIEIGWCEQGESDGDPIAHGHPEEEAYTAYLEWIRGKGGSIGSHSVEQQRPCSPEHPDFLRQEGLLLEISHYGASLVVDELPSVGEKLWICATREPRPTWFTAVVRGCTRTPRGPHLMRIEFNDPCPYDFFSRVVYRRGSR